MTIDRIQRINELLRREIAGVLFRLINEEGFDISAISITHVITSPTLRNARVYVSIRDHKDQRRNMLSVLRSHRAEIQRHISHTVILKYTPRLSFELDQSIEKGDHILDVLSKMENEDKPPVSGPESGAEDADGEV